MRQANQISANSSYSFDKEAFAERSKQIKHFYDPSFFHSKAAFNFLFIIENSFLPNGIYIQILN